MNENNLSYVFYSQLQDFKSKYLKNSENEIWPIPEQLDVKSVILNSPK